MAQLLSKAFTSPEHSVAKDKPETLKSTGKPIIKNKNGSISTERSITVQVQELNKGRHTNIPTIINGKQVSEREAIGHAVKNQAKNKYPNFGSEKEAVTAAKKRSEQLGKDYERQKRSK